VVNSFPIYEDKNTKNIKRKKKKEMPPTRIELVIFAWIEEGF
jgi:hypothetical protein